MFGGGGGFGSQSRGFDTGTPFGTPAASTSAFGSGTGFGTPASSTFGTKPGGLFGGGGTTGAFGTPASGSLFGTSSATPKFGTGSGGMFGGGTSNFGSTGASTGGFGQASPFAAPAPSPFGTAPSTSPFGAARGTSPFGAPPPATTFGATGGSSLFGGGATSSGTGFGGSTFGATPSAFGTPAAKPSGFGGGFGVSGMGTGTAQVPYRMTRSDDKTSGSQSVLLCITAMDEYKNKSIEELRAEDYAAGRKTSGGTSFGGTSQFGQTTGGGFGIGASAFGTPSAPTQQLGFGSTPSTPFGGGFGAPSPAPLFGGTPAPSAFGTTPAPSGFGSTSFGQTPGTAFGAKPTALFGATPAQQTSLFGTPQPASSGFGFGAAAPTPAPSAFGASTSLFGAPAPAPQTSLFGVAPAAAPTGFGFGATAPAPSSLWGTSAPAPVQSFGIGAPAPASGFGASTSLFGTPSAGGFGTAAPAPTGGFGFGPAPTPAPASLFGGTTGFGATSAGPAQTKPAFSLAPATSGSMFSGSLFGAPTPAPAPTGGLFSAPAPSAGGLFGAGFGVPSAAAAPSAGMIAAPITNAYGTTVTTSFGAGALSQKVRDAEQVGKQLEIKLENEQFSTSFPASRASIAGEVASWPPGPFPHIPLTTTKVKPRAITESRVSPGIKQDLPSGFMSPSEFVGTSSKKLVIKREVNELNIPETVPPLEESEQGDVVHPKEIVEPDLIPPDLSQFKRSEVTPAIVPESIQLPETHEAQGPPILTKPCYETIPSIDELQRYSNEDLKHVENFCVRHSQYGKIEWINPVDVRGANLDVLVVIDRNAVAVYDELPEGQKKPPRGQGLNNRARVTLIVPRKPGSNIAAQTRKLENWATRRGVLFVSYNEAGEYTFITEHFSRYELDMDDDSDEIDYASELGQSTLVPAATEFRVPYQDNIDSITRGSPSFRDYRLTNVTNMEDSIDGQSNSGDISYIFDEKEANIKNSRIPHNIGFGNYVHRGETIVPEEVYDDYFQADSIEIYSAIQPQNRLPIDLGFYPVQFSSLKLLPNRDISTNNQLNSPEKSLLFFPPISKRPLSSVILPEVESSTLALIAESEHLSIQSTWASNTMIQLANDFSDENSAHSFHFRRGFRVGWGGQGVFVCPARKKVTLVGFCGGLKSTHSFKMYNINIERTGCLSQGLSTSIQALILHKEYSSMDEESSSDDLNPKENSKESSTSFRSLENLTQSFHCLSLVQAFIAQLENENLSGDIIYSPEWDILQWLKLVNVIWGCEKDPDHSSTFVQTNSQKFTAFSNWLQDAVSVCVRDKKPPDSILDDYDRAIELLTTNKVSVAAEESSELGNLRLGTMLAVVDKENVFYAEEMIKSNLQLKCVGSICKPSLLQLYELLSGGTFSNFFQIPSLNVESGLKGLLWLRHMAVFVWFVHGPKDIQTVVENYFNACRTGTPVVAMPLARYLYDSTHFPEEQVEEESKFIYNNYILNSERGCSLLYNILKLFIGIGRVTDCLDPLCTSPNLLDYSNSWFLMEILYAIGFSCSISSHMQVIDAFVFQLVQANYWEWGAYVYLTISNLKIRNNLVHNLVLQHGHSLLQDQTEENISRIQFLTDQLNIPKVWLWEASAIKFAYNEQFSEAFDAYVNANMVDSARRVLVLHIAPMLICQGNSALLTLGEMIHRLHGISNSGILFGCDVFQDYIEAIENTASTEQLNSLKDRLRVMSRFKQFNENLTCRAALRVMGEMVEHDLSWETK